MRRRRQRFDVDRLIAEELSCYDPGWQALSAGIPVDDDLLAISAAWLAWPGRLPFLDVLSRNRRDPYLTAATEAADRVIDDRSA